MMDQLSKKELSRQFLLSWWDSVQFMAELVPLIAETINTTPENIFYERHLNFDFVFPNKINGTQWRCMFHGIGDCAVTHEIDGRYLEIPFGLNSRFDHVSAFGTLMYIMSTKSPWPEYSELKAFLADGRPSFERFSGSHEKMRMLSDQFYQLPIFKMSDLVMTKKRDRLAKKHSYTNKDGIFITSYGDFSYKKYFEFSVCEWLILNDLGLELINAGLPEKDFSQLWKEAELD